MDEFILDFFVIMNNKMSKLIDVVGKILMFLISCLSHTNNIAGSGYENNRSRIALKILIKDENRQKNF